MAIVTGRLTAVLAAALVSGCVGGAPTPPAADRGAVPVSAILYRDTVNLRFSDGSLCVALRPGGATGWTGLLEGCPHRRSYRVDMPPGRPAARRVLVRLESGGMAVLTLDEAVFGLRPGV